MKKPQLITLFLVFISMYVYADVYIPPTAPQAVFTQSAHMTPVDAKLNSMGVSKGTNGNLVWDLPKGHKPSNSHFGGSKTSNNTVTATKTNPVTFTNSYGAKATGTIKTQTKAGTTSSLAKGFGVMVVGQFATTHHQNLQNQGVSEMISRGFSDGDWTQVVAGLGKAFDWTGIGGIYAQALYGNPSVQQQVIDPLHQQALAQARQDFDNYQRQAQVDPTQYKKYSILTYVEGNLKRSIIIEGSFHGDIGWFSKRSMGNSFTVDFKGRSFDYTFPEGVDSVLFQFRHATEQAIKDINAKNALSIENYLPTEAQLTEMMLNLLNSQNANTQAVTDLVNALWANGGLNPNNTQTQVIGSAADNTFLTAPYTPVGSTQAEQTKITVAPDGTVTATTIPRPDLAANTSQAPTRQEVGKTNSTSTSSTQTQAPKQQSSASAPDVCAMNPNSLMCAEMGSADYEDIALPENKINLNFEPSSTFSTDGTCPAPKTINVLGSSFSLTYQPICDFARGVRPMIILLGMVIAMGMAYSAVKEL